MRSYTWELQQSKWAVTGCFSFTLTTKMLRVNRQPHGHEPASLTFCLLPPQECSDSLFLGWIAATNPCGLAPRKEGKNNENEREDERDKEGEETDCREQNNRLLGKELRLERAEAAERSGVETTGNTRRPGKHFFLYQKHTKSQEEIHNSAFKVESFIRYSLWFSHSLYRTSSKYNYS